MSLAIREYQPLDSLNTFGVAACARWFAEARNDDEAREALGEAQQLGVPLWILGGGSNLLLTADVQALVLHMRSRGVRLLADEGARVILEAEAGEPWHPFVLRSLELGLGGLENLSLIPGTVGAAPIQNVGAYGVEIKDVFAGLTALDCRSGELCEFGVEDCAFGYRDSLFKQQPGRYVILRVSFALSRNAEPKLDYGPLRQQLQQMGVAHPTPADVSRAVCAIRSAKLPDPAQLGNAGSFFKNPLVSGETAATLRSRYPGLVGYPQADGQVKLAAGWLIEQAGWKGFREGDAGVHGLQALVLVNHGRARGAEILALARRIQADIAARFGVALEIEPNIL